MPAGQSQGKAAPARPATKAPTSTLKALPLNPWAPAIAPPPTRPGRTSGPFKPAASTPQQKAAAVTPNATPKARRASALRSIRLGEPITRPQLGALVDPKAQPGSGPVRSSRPAPANDAATSSEVRR